MGALGEPVGEGPGAQGGLLEIRRDQQPADLPRRAVLADGQHRGRGAPHDAAGDATEEDVVERRPAVGPHDQQVEVGRQPQQLAQRLAPDQLGGRAGLGEESELVQQAAGLRLPLLLEAPLEFGVDRVGPGGQVGAAVALLEVLLDVHDVQLRGGAAGDVDGERPGEFGGVAEVGRVKDTHGVPPADGSLSLTPNRRDGRRGTRVRRSPHASRMPGAQKGPATVSGLPGVVTVTGAGRGSLWRPTNPVPLVNRITRWRGSVKVRHAGTGAHPGGAHGRSRAARPRAPRGHARWRPRP